MSAVIIWKLVSRFWQLGAIAVLIGVIWFQAAQVTKVRKDRDQWRSSALAYQVSAGEWNASFKASEKMRQDDQQVATQAFNASEASCDARVEKARSSAVKIERLVTNVPTCKPGETIERKLIDPRALSDAIGLR